MGARLRLKANVNGTDPALRTSDPNVQKIFRAMQKYGLIVADNGSDLYITGTFDTRWNNDILNPAFSLLSASDFDVIQLGWTPPAGTAAALSALSASPNQVVGGSGATGTVTLSAAAPNGGAVVSLSSASGAVSVPASVAVPQSATAASFSITTSAVTSTTSTTLSAVYAGITKTTTFTVTPAATSPSLATLTLNKSTVVGGTVVTATVSLTAPAPNGGATIALSSSEPQLASVPTTIVIGAGATSAIFAISTATTRKNAIATITSTYAGVTKTATLKITRR